MLHLVELHAKGGGFLAIGLTKAGTDKWTWMDGKTDYSWTNWIAGIPGTDACVLATLKNDDTFMRWLDVRCDGDFGPLYALCEIA